MTAAWGTPDAGGVADLPPVAAGESLYAVVGFFGYDGTRYFDHVPAPTPRAAEDRARAAQAGQRAPDGSPGDFQVCAVLTIVDGRITPIDGYATYLDPDAPAAEGAAT